jgi:hypothetical protein
MLLNICCQSERESSAIPQLGSWCGFTVQLRAWPSIVRNRRRPCWGSRFFDGSYNVEVGLYHEPVALPVGFRTYFKYEKWQKSQFWSRVEREHVGIEAYVKF